MYEIRVVRENGELETHWVDGPVHAGERLKIEGRRMVVLKRVRPSSRAAEAAFVCLEVPKPQPGWMNIERAA